MGKVFSVYQAIAVADPDAPTHILRPNSDGSINTNQTISATIGDFALANAAAPTWVEGTAVEASVDLAGNQRTRNDRLEPLVGSLTEAAPGTDTASSGLNGRLQRIAQRLTSILAALTGTLTVQLSYLFANVTAGGATTVKSGAGTLRSVTINTKGTIASTVTIYDNTAGSGTKIGTIDSLTLSGQFAFDVAFATGLTVVTTGTAAPDITVAYR